MAGVEVLYRAFTGESLLSPVAIEKKRDGIFFRSPILDKSTFVTRETPFYGNARGSQWVYNTHTYTWSEKSAIGQIYHMTPFSSGACSGHK